MESGTEIPTKNNTQKKTAAVWYDIQKVISGPWLETEFKILKSGSGQVKSLRETALLCSTMESWLEFPSSKSGRAVTGLIASLAASNPTVHRGGYRFLAPATLTVGRGVSLLLPQGEGGRKILRPVSQNNCLIPIPHCLYFSVHFVALCNHHMTERTHVPRRPFFPMH